MSKAILLKEITLSNWRGLNLNVKFNEDVTKISAKNATGKSSIMKAWYWVLTGYPSPTETLNYNLFSNLEELTPDTPKASVKVILNIDGYDYSIEKVAEAKFTRRRGSSEYEKAQSDTYTVLLDNITISTTDYKEWLEANIAPVDMLPYCLDGGFMVEKIMDDKNKSRKVLESIIDEIKDEDMQGDYAVLKHDMQRFTIEQIEERTKAELKPYKKRAEEIPAIIDDKERSLAEYKTIDFDAIKAEIEKTKKEIVDLDDAILGKGKEIEPIMGERNRILSLVNEKVVAMNNAKNAYLAKEGEKVNAVVRELQCAKDFNVLVHRNNEARKHEFENTKVRLSQSENELVLLEEKRENLIKERDEIKARVFETDRCLYCGQSLPIDKLEIVKAEFNQSKEAELAIVVARGKNNKETIDTIKKAIKELQKKVDEGYKEEELKDTTEIEERLAKIQAGFTPFEETKECARLTDEIKALEATIPEIPSNDTSALTDVKKILMDTLEELNRRYGLSAKKYEIESSIVELREELKSVGICVAALEGKIDKCKEYRQERAEIVSHRINDRLEETHVDMWSTLKDGTITPDVVLRGKDNVKYPSLNTAQQIKTRIEVQRMFLAAFGIENFPLFVDESAVFSQENLPVLDMQTTYLFASESPVLVVA